MTTDSEDEGLPLWLCSLMILCCSCRDYAVQHTAMTTFLELVNHSQSLALVIQDKHRRYRSADSNPLSGRLQMATVPPVLPDTLASIEEGTNFYQVGGWLGFTHAVSWPLIIFSCYATSGTRMSFGIKSCILSLSYLNARTYKHACYICNDCV